MHLNFKLFPMQHKVNNPFFIVGDIPEKYFCDRNAETRKIVRGIANGSNLLIISPRRMGKSKLVLHSFRQEEIQQEYYTFYIDLLHTTSLRELTYTFGMTIFKKLSTISQKALLSLVQTLKSLTGTFGFDPVTGLPTFTLERGRIAQPEFTLSEIFQWLENCEKPCVVCFDEFQCLNKYADNKNGEIEALLRGHIQHLSNTRFIFSGSERHLLLEMFHSAAKPFYNSTSLMDLAAIPKDVYTCFAQQHFEEFGKHLDISSLETYYDLFEGSTFYLQKLLHEAFIDCSVNETCTKAMLDSTFEYILDEYADAYRKTLGTLNERQKDTLYAIAREGHAKRIMSISFIKRYALESPSIVQTAVKKLMEYELITQNEGEYYVSDILFSLFLKRGE